MSDVATVADAFDRITIGLAARVAVHDGGAELTFAELRRWSERVSKTLDPRTRVGQRVALMLPNSAAFVAALYGVARVGGVVVPLYPRSRPTEIRDRLDDLRPASVVVSPALVDALREAWSETTYRPALLVLSPPDGVTVVEEGDGSGDTLRWSEGVPLLQQFTSGSTGRPKCVVRTHAALRAELDALASVFDLGPGDRFLGAAPFSHVNGLVRTLMTAMHVGGTLYPLDEFQRRPTLELLSRHAITFFCGVAQMFSILSRTPSRSDVTLTTVRHLVSASAPLHVEDNRRFRDRYGAFVRQLYGSTETGTIAVNRDAAVEATLDSVGTPLPGVRVDVVAEHGRPLAAGHEGELVITSSFAARRYVDDDDGTGTGFRNGAFFSGDLGVCDHDGHLRLTGRIKLLINRAGFKVNPLEVEAVVARYPGIEEVAVVGGRGEHGDEHVRCIVVTSRPCTPDEVVTHCRRYLSDYKVPSHVEFRDRLPRSSAGKLLRSEI